MLPGNQTADAQQSDNICRTRKDHLTEVLTGGCIEKCRRLILAYGQTKFSEESSELCVPAIKGGQFS